jgi:hypothetical protein
MRDCVYRGGCIFLFMSVCSVFRKKKAKTSCFEDPRIHVSENLETGRQVSWSWNKKSGPAHYEAYHSWAVRVHPPRESPPPPPSFLLSLSLSLPWSLVWEMGRRRPGGGGRGGGRGQGRGRGGEGRGGGEEEDLQLHKAARSGDAAAVESLCESNPLALNSRDRLSRTP